MPEINELIYNGLRIYQELLNPHDIQEPITIAPERILREHPEWMLALQAAYDYISATLYEHQNDMPRTRRVLDEETKRRAMQDLLNGVSPRTIAMKYGVSRATVYSWRQAEKRNRGDKGSPGGKVRNPTL